MCGILGLVLADEEQFVNQMLFDGLTVLQHRGQDAAGIVTTERLRLHLRKDNGLVKDVFQAHHMKELRGNVGIGHVRYPTAGSSSCAEAQPLYTNFPYGICVAHNGNLTNTEELADLVRNKCQRHINTESDSELLLNIFADLLTKTKEENMVDNIFKAIEGVMQHCTGGYAGLYLINGVGLVGFRDPHGIRPIVYGRRASSTGFDHVIASESVAIDTLGFKLVRDIQPGEAMFIDVKNNNCHTRKCHRNATLTPCIFEYVYFARPDSIMDGVSVYQSRLCMGEKLALHIMQKYPNHDIDVVIPIPDTSRTSALQAAYVLGRPFREGFIKNRYIARTFIMPGQETRKKSVRLKLNTIKSEFRGKNVLLVDDSVVRGTTSKEIVQMAREAGAKKVYFTSAAPPIRYPNIYGIDIPTRDELIAYNRNEKQISDQIGCDWIVYQNLKALEDAVIESSRPEDPLTHFDTSCFSGTYVTGENITDDYFKKLNNLRNDEGRANSSSNLSQQSQNGCESISNDISEVEDSSSACEGLNNNMNSALQ